MTNIEPDSPPVALITACVVGLLLLGASLVLLVTHLVTGTDPIVLLAVAWEQVATVVRAAWDAFWRAATWFLP